MVSREESVQRIAAAVEARNTSNDIIILARTDARQAESFDEALYRIQAFADAGADMLFIDALETVEEMEKFCALCPSIPKLANMLEGGGKTPILTPEELESIGYKLVAYPLSLMGVSIRAMQRALEGLRHGQIPDLNFRDMQEILGFDDYFNERDGYVQKAEEILDQRSATSFTPSDAGLTEETISDTLQKRNGTTAPTTLEADAILTPEEEEAASKARIDIAIEIMPDEEDEQEEEMSDKKWFPRVARIRVTDTVREETKLELKVPVGFLNDAAQYVPALDGADLTTFLTKEHFPDGKPALQFKDGNDLVEIYLE